MGGGGDSAPDRDYLRVLVNALLNLRVPKAMEFVCEGVYHPYRLTRAIGYSDSSHWNYWENAIEIRVPPFGLMKYCILVYLLAIHTMARPMIQNTLSFV